MVKKSERGVTVIELLLVTVILGILAITVLLGLNPMEQVRKSRDAGKVSRAKEAIPAAERYYSIQLKNPVNCDTLITAKELKAGACDGITLVIVSEGVYQTTFAPESKVYQDICGGPTCTVPDDLL